MAETGSVSRAAARVHLSQPTLSRRIAELETHLGVPLLYRTPTGVRLTAEGERLYHGAAGVLRSFEELEGGLRREAGDRAALVKISASEGMTRHWLLPRLARFATRHPDARFELAATTEALSLVDYDLDFVIRLGDPRDAELVGRKVGSLVFGLFASEGYLAKRVPILTRADLAAEEVIGRGRAVSPFGDEPSRLMPAFADPASPEAPRRWRIEPFAGHYDAVRQGLGVAMLAVPFARADGLVEILADEARFAVDIWLLRRRETALRKPHRDFARFLARELATSRAWFDGQG